MLTTERYQIIECICSLGVVVPVTIDELPARDDVMDVKVFFVAFTMDLTRYAAPWCLALEVITFEGTLALLGPVWYLR